MVPGLLGPRRGLRAALHLGDPASTGTRLTLWHNINKGFFSMGAAGWHICFDVLTPKRA